MLFTVPGTEWEVSSYGFFLGLALIAGWILSLALAGRDRLPADRLGTSYVVAVAFGLFGARAAWLVQHPDAWTGWASLVSLSSPGQGGMAPFFGVVVGLLVTGMHVQRMRVPVLGWFDVAAPALALGLVLERIGALLAGLGHGRYAPDFPLALRFPVDSPAFVEQRRTVASLLPAGATESLPVYPTQLVAILVGLVALAIAFALRKRRRFGGQVFLAVAITIVAGRSFVEEPLRADRAQATIGPASPGQIGAALLVVAMAVVYRTRSRKAAEGAPDMRPWEGGKWSPKPPAAAAKRAGTTAADPRAASGKGKGKGKGKR
ncbi:MAG TPA: prolipoprotein diacylglyceryl transferase family protein [Nannocystaceae bacterium]|nr:prolipoprotein diacylglyceryl transferase family protein [Nannocystaceae bacterium]